MNQVDNNKDDDNNNNNNNNNNKEDNLKSLENNVSRVEHTTY